jgi:hypothetical protein
MQRFGCGQRKSHNCLHVNWINICNYGKYFVSETSSPSLKIKVRLIFLVYFSPNPHSFLECKWPPVTYNQVGCCAAIRTTETGVDVNIQGFDKSVPSQSELIVGEDMRNSIVAIIIQHFTSDLVKRMHWPSAENKVNFFKPKIRF